MNDKTNSSPDENGDRQLLEAAKAWFDEAAPGVERSAGIPVPLLADAESGHFRPRRSVVSRAGVHMVRFAGIAAVFALGYFAGIRRNAVDPARDSATTEPTQQTVEHLPVPEPPQVPASKMPSRQTATAAEQAPQAADEPQPYTRESNGRVQIDTRLRGNGAHVTWIVDGTFQLAQASQGEN
jgi:hypothetical protein